MMSNSPDKISNGQSPRYEFAEFSFDVRDKVLYKSGEIISLAPKACELLGVFLENAGKLIGKEELMNQVWNDSFVEEANLTHHISALRKALGEDKNGRKFIETIPRKGYRFVAELKNAANPESSAEIVISERETLRTIEGTVFESEDLTVEPQIALTTAEAAPKKSRRPVWILTASLLVLIIGASAFFGYRNFYSAKNSAVPNEISFKRLTPDADVSAPSVSPDGASIVFVKNENGQRSLWRKTIASGEMTQLTPAVSMTDFAIYSTRFSPDGRWIYYTQFIANDAGKTQSDERNLTIYRIPSGGGAAQKILSGLETDFSISPDGKQIAYIFDYRQVIVADIETGNKRVVIDRDGVNRLVKNEGSAAWSPDGTRLIFPAAAVEDNRSFQQLWEINLRSGAERQIPVPELFTVNQVEWLADDSGLIVTHPDNIKNEIWRVDHRTGATKRLSDESGDFGYLRLSADSKTLIIQKFIGQFNIWTAPVDDLDKRRQITIGAAAKHGTAGLTLMPDGRIFYTSTESGAVDIWTINETGGDRRQLTAGAGTVNENPQPTSDGRYIVFLSKRSGMSQIWRMDADGGNPVQLSKVIETYGFSLSPENDVYYITFLADEQKYQIYKVPVTGGEPIKIDDYYCIAVPDFSPDGKWMLFFGGKTKDDKPRIGIIERATGKIIRYIDLQNYAPTSWSSDSKSIIVTMNNGQELWRQPIDGSALEKIYDLSPLKIQNWDFSADGKRVVFSLGNSTSEIVAIQNFSEGAK